MFRGLDPFRSAFAGYEDQYILIGGVACDILFAKNEGVFRATRDIDMVLLVEALTPEFGARFWEFIRQGEYQTRSSGMGTPRFYRFEKPIKGDYPKMIELFGRTDYDLRELNGITPVHVGDAVSSLSAILLNEDYYKTLLQGRTVIDGVSVLRAEYLILFKARAYLDLKRRRQQGEHVDAADISKHKNDSLRITAELVLEDLSGLPEAVGKDFAHFLDGAAEEPFNETLLRKYGLKNEEVLQRLKQLVL